MTLRSRFTDKEILDAVANFKTKSAAAAELGISPQLLRYWLLNMSENEPSAYQPKIWIYDIETSLALASVWGMWQKVTTLESIQRDWQILTWAGKWFGTDKVLHDSCHLHDSYDPAVVDDFNVCQSLWEKFDEADIVVAYNGNKFDQKKANARYAINGMLPPRPYKQIDPMMICKANFAFTSNRLEYVAQKLCGYGKLDSGGYQSWIGALYGDRDAWDTMVRYNIGDVDVLEDVWVAVAPWDKRTPNSICFNDRTVPQCTNVACGSTNIVENGQTVRTGVSEFVGYTCLDCGHHMRGRKNIRSKEQMVATLMNVT